MKTPAGMLRVLGPAAVLALAVVPPATAGDVTDLAREAEGLLAEGEPATAFDTMNAAVDAFWRAAPLIIEDARFDHEGDSATFAPATRVGIHLRPLGYGFDETDGNFRISLDTDVEIRSPGGLILAKSEDFARLEWTGATRNRTFTARISIDMPDLKPGDYELRLTVTDAVSEKTANITLPFSITAQ
jgi:hypothetical protein